MKAKKHFRSLLLSTSILAFGGAATASADQAELDKGKAVYNGIGACASCHGPLGAGDGVAAAALNPKPRSFVAGTFSYDTDADGKTGTQKDLENIIEFGAAKYKGSMLMAGRPDIAAADRTALAKYVLSLKK